MTAQVLTGFIWYDMNYGKALEIPTRVLAAKLSDSISLIEISKIEDERLLIKKLSNPQYKLSEVDGLPRLNALKTRDRAVELLFKHVFEQEFGRLLPIHITDIELHDDHGQEAGWLDLFEAHYPSAHFTLYVQLANGQWLRLDAYEGQAGMSMAPLMDLFDYLFRIYFIRIVVIIGIALFAVRQIMRPLNRLAAAAERLGRNIYSPPLDIDGPTEVRRSAKAFNLMQQRLIDTVTEKTRFLAAISHDLRSPITRLRLRTEQIDQPVLRDKFRRDLEDMENLISSTVDFMRGVEVHENRHPININAMLQGLQVDAQETGAEVSLHGEAVPIDGYASVSSAVCRTFWKTPYAMASLRISRSWTAPAACALPSAITAQAYRKICSSRYLNLSTVWKPHVIPRPGVQVWVSASPRPLLKRTMEKSICVTWPVVASKC